MNNNMTTDKPMSNEEVIEVLKGLVFNSFDRTTSKERQALDLAIKALAERPKGEWINHRNDYGHNIADCSLCGKAMQWHDEDEDGIPRYCWYCGAEMKNTDPIIKAIQENNAKYDERPNIDFSRMSYDLGGGEEE